MNLLQTCRNCWRWNWTSSSLGHPVSRTWNDCHWHSPRQRNGQGSPGFRPSLPLQAQTPYQVWSLPKYPIHRKSRSLSFWVWHDSIHSPRSGLVFVESRRILCFLESFFHFLEVFQRIRFCWNWWGRLEVKNGW